MKILISFLLLLSLPLYGEVIKIYCAGSLFPYFKALKKMVKEENWRIYSGGSVLLIRQIKDLGKRPDFLAVADARLIKEELIPEFTSYVREFATNEMVIVVKEGIEIKRLPEDLLRLKLGRSDPLFDPCGYYTLMVWKLMEKYYERKGFYQRMLEQASFIRPKSLDLITYLKGGVIDACFLYRSEAVSFHLKFFSLPSQVNLGDSSFKKMYEDVVVKVGDEERRGRLIVYGLTSFSEEGKKVERAVLSEVGRKLLKKMGFGVILTSEGRR